jgi:hypothetical protein
VQRIALLLVISILYGCIGVNAHVVIKADGSGTMVLEYTVGKSVESLGRQDGNASQPPIAIAKRDFQRTVSRIPGLKLQSFKTKTTARDVITTVRLAFKNREAFINFFNAQGSRAYFTENNQLNLLFTEGINPIDPELYEALRTVSDGYTVTMSFSLPASATLRLVRGADTPETVTTGTNVSFTLPLLDMLSGVQAELTW